CGVPHAVLLPSARAGICWALRTVTNDCETLVVGPAYTCQVVHESMSRSAQRLRFVDTDLAGFLMDRDALIEQRGKYAVVQCEIYGYSYSANSKVLSGRAAPLLRIIDAAMTVPGPRLFESMSGSDFGVISFGLGKCLYAGWGGMGFTKSDAVAQEIRSRRDAALHAQNLVLSLRRIAVIALRLLAHTAAVYKVSKRFRRPPRVFPTVPSHWTQDRSLSKEWYLSSTQIDRRLAYFNRKRSLEYHQQRLSLAARYHRDLNGMTGVILPPASSNALSHYTVRVPTAWRDPVRTSLESLGVDTGVLFRFPGYLANEQFPNANRLSLEVINLPLDPCLSEKDIDYISDCLVRSLSCLASDGREPEQGRLSQSVH